MCDAEHAAMMREKEVELMSDYFIYKEMVRKILEKEEIPTTTKIEILRNSIPDKKTVSKIVNELLQEGTSNTFLMNTIQEMVSLL